MRGFLIVVLCAVYSVQANEWVENFGNLHILTATGTVPQKYYPVTEDDKHATRKAGAFVSFIKIVPQINPLQLASLGPYSVALPDVNFQGDMILRNAEVHGIKGLALSDLELRMNPGRLDFNATIPQIGCDVNFEIQAMLSNQPLNVNGQMSVNIRNLVLLAAIGTKVVPVDNEKQVFQVDTAEIDLAIGNLELSVAMDQYANDFRAITVQFLNNTNKYSSIVDDILRTVLQAINKELTIITAKEILQYLLGSARPSLSG